MKRVKPTDKNISPNRRRLRLMELSGIPLSEIQKKRLLSESVSMVLPPLKHERDKIKNSMIWNGNDISDIDDDEEVDLDEILREMGYGEDENEEEEIEKYENMSDIPNLTDDEIDSILSGLEDDSVNEFNFTSKGYKEGKKLVDKLRRELFRKLSDDELEEFMNVLSNSFDLVRK